VRNNSFGGFQTDSPEKTVGMSHMVNTLSKLNCCFRAQGWRVVPLIRLARLAVRLAQVCQCSFNHTVPNSNLKDKPQTRVIFKHGVQFSLSLSHTQSESADRDRWINLTLEASNEVCRSRKCINRPFQSCLFGSETERVLGVRNHPYENAFLFGGFPGGLHLRQRHLVAYFIPLYLSVHFLFSSFQGVLCNIIAGSQV